MNFSWTRKLYLTNIFNSFALMSVPFHVPLIYWRAWCMIMHIYVFCINCIMVELSDNHTHTNTLVSDFYGLLHFFYLNFLIPFTMSKLLIFPSPLYFQDFLILAVAFASLQIIYDTFSSCTLYIHVEWKLHSVWVWKCDHIHTTTVRTIILLLLYAVDSVAGAQHGSYEIPAAIHHFHIR